MAAGDLRTTVRRRGATTVIDLAGDVDRTADAPLRQAYEQAAAEPGRSVLLNFTGVGYINSTGIAVLAELLTRAREQRQPLAACGLTEHYRHVFSITRLSDFIEIYPDEDRAVGDNEARAAHRDSQ